MPDDNAPKPPPKTWSPIERVGFRFALIYVALYVLVPDVVWKPLVPKFGALVGVEVLYLPNGSGDTTYNYVLVFARLVLALLGMGIWSALDRKRERYPRLAEWTLVLLRYYLAAVLLSYGFSKVFLLQFSQPSLFRLVEPLGQMSPMGLAWTFTGFSPGYQFFGGALEVLAGLLLLSRRTTTLGALVGFGVMANVAMLNYCFDVPVKLFSTHLLVFLLGLAAIDGRRLLALLVFNQASEPVVLQPHFSKRKAHIAGRVVKGLVIAALILPGAIGSFQSRETYGPGAPRSPLYGIYEVVEMHEDGEPRPGLIDDDERWRHVIFDGPQAMTIQTMDGAVEWYGLELELEAGTLTLTKGQGEPFDQFLIDPPPPVEPLVYEWTIEELGAGELALAGELEGKQIEVRVKARELDFLLTNRGFNWVNEYPLNR